MDDSLTLRRRIEALTLALAASEDARAQSELCIAQLREEAESALRASDARYRDMIAARKLVEDALVENLDIMERAQAVAHIGHWQCELRPSDRLLYERRPPDTLDGRQISWSHECASIFGGVHDAPPTLNAFSETVHVDDRPAVSVAVERMFAEDVPCTSEHRIVRPDGSMRWVNTHAVLVRDASGGAIRVSGVVQDITERHMANEELRRTESHLRQAQKMEAVGSLAGGIAHDFNNLLSVILSYTTLALEDLVSSELLRADIEEIHWAARRAAELTRQLLAFSRKQVLEPQSLDLNQCVSGLERILARVLGEDIDIALSLAPTLGTVFADPGQVEQVIMNLVVNARDAMPNGGKLTLETADVVLDAAQVAGHPGAAPGHHVKLAVSDTGIGMDARVLARVFEPFFTTKDEGKGTGLGLATVFGIVTQSGGHIAVSSTIGSGTTFNVYFPRSDREAEQPWPTSQAPRSLRGDETILLVEDQDSVRAIVRTVLKRHGYTVLDAANGADALVVCEQLDRHIHLLLTDVVMPHLNGPNLAARVVAMRPTVKVLYMSGYAKNKVLHDGSLDVAGVYLQKPITPDALLRKVRDALEQEPSRVSRF